MKKNTKKFVAFLLCLTLIVSMSISAFAVDADEEPYKDPEESSRFEATDLDGTWITLVHHTGVNLRAHPSTSSNILGCAYRGDSIYIVRFIFIEEAGHIWAQVIFNGIPGFMDNRYLG